MDISRVVNAFGEVAKRAKNSKQVELRPKGRGGRMSKETLKGKQRRGRMNPFRNCGQGTAVGQKTVTELGNE